MPAGFSANYKYATYRDQRFHLAKQFLILTIDFIFIHMKKSNFIHEKTSIFILNRKSIALTLATRNR